jgi:hypothetical protein
VQQHAEHTQGGDDRVGHSSDRLPDGRGVRLDSGCGEPAQWVIIGALIIEAALIIGVLGFFSALTACSAPVPRGAGPGGRLARRPEG